MSIYAQGDILLVKTEKPAKLPRREPLDTQGRVVLAHGEVTGHAHAIHRGAVLFRDAGAGSGILEVGNDGADLVHEEHGTIALEPGVYRVVRQMEWSDENEPITVAD